MTPEARRRDPTPSNEADARPDAQAPTVVQSHSTIAGRVSRSRRVTLDFARSLATYVWTSQPSPVLDTSCRVRFRVATASAVACGPPSGPRHSGREPSSSMWRIPFAGVIPMRWPQAAST
jgi:hypothetical protein